MDTTLDRIGIYDLFGTFLSGAIMSQFFYYFVILFLSPEAGKSLIQIEPSELSLDALSGIALSFLVGLILESSASIAENKIFHFRSKAMRLITSNAQEVISVDISPANFESMKRYILRSASSNVSECRQGEYIYQQCKIYLEAKRLNAREQSINAIYVLTRNVMVGLGFSIILYIVILYLNFSVAGALYPSLIFSIMLIALLLLCIVALFFRCISYSKYRVRVILREYYHQNHQKFVVEASSSP